MKFLTNLFKKKNNSPLKGMNCEQILSAINIWAETGDNIEISKLWHILTALRGPDSENHHLKMSTTCIIRAHTLPNLAKGRAFVDHHPSDYKELIRISMDSYGHFEHHIDSAIESIPSLKKIIIEESKKSV